jgi:hypothetical protein
MNEPNERECLGYGDASVFAAMSAKNKARIAKEKRKDRNLRIGRIALFGLCAAGCVASAVACIRNGLWYAAIAPVALVAVSAFNIKR